MNASTLSTSSFFHARPPSSSAFNPPPLSPLLPFKPHSLIPVRPSLRMVVRASARPTSSAHPILQNLQSFSKFAILLGAAASLAFRFSQLPARAQVPVTVAASETPTPLEDEGEQHHYLREEEGANLPEQSPPLSELVESGGEAVHSLKALLQEKLESGQDEEALKILERLVSAQPSVSEWKFLMARLLSEMGQTENARKVFEEILAADPLSFEALFENALLMDRCGQGEAVIKRLQEALDIAGDEKKVKEVRDVKLVMAQIQFLQKNVDEALESYQQLSKEDPSDFRPYFCRGMIYSLLDRNEEASEQFAKCRELSPKKFEVDGYLRTPLSRMKLFGSNEDK